MLVSIIINNYNYDRYLAEAIDSALAQTFSNIELIVVDDGSTDNSRNVITGYGDRIKPVLKPNGGQASAFNAGFSRSDGEIILFLDSDDALFPAAVENAIRSFTSADVTKTQWPLWVVDEAGNRTGEMRPSQIPPEGDFRDVVLQGGPTSCTSSPTSGNAWTRHFLEKIFPIPEDVSYYKTCADEYLYTLAPVFGRVKTIRDPQGFYRIHGRNIYSALSFKEKLKLELSGHVQQTAALSAFLEEQGFQIDVDLWRKNSWFHRLEKSLIDIESHISTDVPFIFVDDETWNITEIYPMRKIFPFMERDGKPWGRPESDDVAITELNRLRTEGADFIVFAWPSFWWLTHYSGLNKYIRSNFKSVLENERIIVFDLRES